MARYSQAAKRQDAALKKFFKYLITDILFPLHDAAMRQDNDAARHVRLRMGPARGTGLYGPTKRPIFKATSDKEEARRWAD